MGYLSNIVISTFSNTLFIVFAIIVLGYLIGRVEIKGVGLGSAGVFLAALVFGHFGFRDTAPLHAMGLLTVSEESLKSGMSLVQNMGLLCFVTAVGFIAGPNFFSNLKRNAKSYVLIAAVIIGSAAAACMTVIKLTNVDAPMAVGLLTGALTSTPGFSAAQDAVRNSQELLDQVTVGYAIGYPFGVVGVVLFVQLVPKLLRVNIQKEVDRITASGKARVIKGNINLLELDPMGIGVFAAAVALGIFVGKWSVPLPGGAKFSLGNTGGALITALVLGHFGHIGRLSLQVPKTVLKTFREFGLVLFLIGAGVPGGADFVRIIQEYGAILFAYGAVMEIIAMVLGFIIARYVVRLCLFNNLGSITGGMTSTPALGALISTAQSDDVASSYAATYPVALVLVVLAAQLIVTFL